MKKKTTTFGRACTTMFFLNCGQRRICTSNQFWAVLCSKFCQFAWQKQCRFFLPRPHPFSGSRRILSQNLEKFPAKIGFSSRHRFGNPPGAKEQFPKAIFWLLTGQQKFYQSNPMILLAENFFQKSN
jgi:hypothetical protein